jgi:predicted dehydrogenase
MAKAGLAPARDLVRSGALGRIVFCRAFQGNARDSLGALQFLLDAPSPVSVTQHGAGRVTLRYPGFIASYEIAPKRQEYGIVICGSRATLVVKSNGWRVFGQPRP